MSKDFAYTQTESHRNTLVRKLPGPKCSCLARSLGQLCLYLCTRSTFDKSAEWPPLHSAHSSIEIHGLGPAHWMPFELYKCLAVLCLDRTVQRRHRHFGHCQTQATFGGVKKQAKTGCCALLAGTAEHGAQNRHSQETQTGLWSLEFQRGQSYVFVCVLLCAMRPAADAQDKWEEQTMFLFAIISLSVSSTKFASHVIFDYDYYYDYYYCHCEHLNFVHLLLTVSFLCPPRPQDRTALRDVGSSCD